MVSKEKEKLKAIQLRRQGFSYSEIMAKVPVAKSSLALWLQFVGLSKRQQQRISDKKLAAGLRGALRKKQIRIIRSRDIKRRAESEVGSLSAREIWLIGVALYWAEGSKEKEWRPGSGAQFTNSDPAMIQFFLRWLLKVCRVPKESIIPELYIHESLKNVVPKVIGYWSDQTGFPVGSFVRVYFKKNKINTKRKNISDNYYGILRLVVKASSELNRKISGWTGGIIKGSLKS